MKQKSLWAYKNKNQGIGITSLAEVKRLEPTKENLEIEAAICLELEEWMEREELKCNFLLLFIHHNQEKKKSNK